MWKINKKNKIILVKVYILFVFSWLILSLYVGFRYESGMNSEWEYLFLLMMIKLKLQYLWVEKKHIFVKLKEAFLEMCCVL